MDVEIGLITKLLQDKDYIKVKDKQITPSFFDKETRKYMTFIDNYYIKHGVVPTIRVFLNTFSDVELERTDDNEIGTDEPIEYWCDEVRKRKIHNTMAYGLTKVAEYLDEGNIDNAMVQMTRTLNFIETGLVESTAIKVTRDSDDRKKRYEERVRTQGMLGIETGIKLLDYMLKGFQGKQLITLMAKTSTGKTWLFILFACYMWIQGYRVLFFTTEMSEEQIEDRLEAMAVGKMYGDFNYKRFRSGKLTKEEKEKYFKFLDKKSHMEDFIIDTATTVSALRAKVEQNDIDIVFVDSAYLMQDELGSEADHQRVTNVFRGLKKVAKELAIPICANTQQDLKSKGGLESINFARAITHESDVVMRLERTEEMIEDAEAKLILEKQREGELGSIMLDWDFETMNFGGIYSTQGDTDTSNDELDDGVLGID